MANHPTPPQDLNALLIQLATQSSGVQVPQANRGLLAPGQESFGDVLRDPSQSQISGLLTGLAASLNPNTVSPIASGLIGGLQGFQARENVDLRSRQQAAEFKRKQLQDRIGNIIDISRLGLGQETGQRAERAFQQIELPREQRLAGQQEFQQALDFQKLEVDIAKQGDIFEDQVGTDELGGPITAQFRRNPVTGETVQLSSGITTTTPAKRAAVSELTSKGLNAISSGSIFFDKDLDQIFGPLELRPLIGGLTEGAIAGKAKKLDADFNRFVTERVLDVARVLAPVTDVDVQLLTRQLAPGTTLGSAEEARAWYTGQFLPKIISEVRFNASPTQALKLVNRAISTKGMSNEDAVGIIGNGPTFEEVQGFVKGDVYMTFSNDAPLSGKAITGDMLKELARINKMTVTEFIKGANLRKVQ